MIRNILGWKHGELDSGPGPAAASQLCNFLGHLLCNWDMNQFIRSKDHVCGYHHPSIFQLVMEKMHRNQSAGATVQRKTPCLVRCPAEVKKEPTLPNKQAIFRFTNRNRVTILVLLNPSYFFTTREPSGLLDLEPNRIFPYPFPQIK